MKAQTNLTKHGVTFAQAATVLPRSLALTVFDAAHSDGEDRWFTLGRSEDGRLLAVSHTYEPSNATRAQVRLISAREATRRERMQYENEPR
ncbi:MAG: BrnT family toxin [Candidatus Competibacteraceae bacterium]|nr:BrnT family toxin [Candidatus Competibacteraceae bacterium]